VSVDNPAFRYSSDVRLNKRQLRLRYSYVALRDHVALEDLDKYLADRADMEKDLGYRLTKKLNAASDPGDYAIAPLPLFVLLAALAGGAFLALRIYRLDVRSRAVPAGNANPQGIRGWLVLPALQVVLLPFALIWLLGVSCLYVRSSVWGGIVQLAAPEASVWVRWALLAGFGAMGALLPIAIASALLFFRKRTAAPVVFVAVMFATLVFSTLLEGVFTYAGLDDSAPRRTFWAETARDTLACAVWCAYMIRSRRVRATFVTRRPPRIFRFVPTRRTLI